MIEIAVWALTVVFVVVSAWLHTRWRVRDLRVQHAAELARLTHELNTKHELATRVLAYAQWWARNAAESPLTDSCRTHFFRYALSALLAPNLETLHRELASLAQRHTNAEGKIAIPHALAAALARDELTMNPTPWVAWLANPATHNKPLHNPYAVGQCFQASIDGWEVILGKTADGSPGNSQQSAPDTSAAKNS